MRAQVSHGQVAQHRASTPSFNPAHSLPVIAGDVVGCSDRIFLLSGEGNASLAQILPQFGAEIRSADLHDFHRFLPAFQTVDVAGANESAAKTSRRAELIVVGKVRAGFG